MDLLYFVILIGSLIFVHELGHFLLAKAFGVKVLTFSLGFGPKILKLRGRETEYCISLLPLGGYVEMLEAAKSDVVLPEDRKRTFESLPIYKRLIVVMGGPLMNLIFPVLLYFSVFVSDGPFLPPMVAVVLPGHAAQGKLEPGDRIMSVDGREVGTFDEVKRIVAKSPGKLLRFKVFRENKHVDVDVTVEDTTDRQELDIIDHVGSIGITASPPAPVIGIPSSDSPSYRAGLRTFDVVTHVGGKPIRRYMDLVEELAENHGETMPVTYLRPVTLPRAFAGLSDMAVFEAGVVALTPDANGTDMLSRTGIELADLYAAVVPEDSYFYKAGLRPGDKILRLDDEPMPAWSTFRERLRAGLDAPHRIEYLAARDGRTRSGTFQVRREEIQHWIPLAPEERVEHPAPIRYAFEKAVQETLAVTRFILVSFVRLAEGKLSLSSLSGPIKLYEVAGQEGRKGPDYFIWVMAVISINLGLLNLLPIPVLDGGHVAFFMIEAAMRRPIPLRIREIAHLVGMAILLGLMILVCKNDVEERWDVILSQIRELIG